jgi:hypothetical protein
MSTLHLVTFANGEPFATTQKTLEKTINNNTCMQVELHSFNLEKIQTKEYFQYIKNNPLFVGEGKRDGYWNAWKAFVVNEVYSNMREQDILYYVDSSRYYLNGFSCSIDKTVNYCINIGSVFGSIGNDVRNNSFGCCDNLDVWFDVWPQASPNILRERHVLNSWFFLTKNSYTTNFLEEWCFFSGKKMQNIPLPAWHHTGDQSIFNILAYKHNCKVFYDLLIDHNSNKNYNLVNENTNNNRYTFVNLNDLISK